MLPSEYCKSDIFADYNFRGVCFTDVFTNIEFCVFFFLLCYKIIEVLFFMEINVKNEKNRKTQLSNRPYNTSGFASMLHFPISNRLIYLWRVFHGNCFSLFLSDLVVIW